MSNQTRILTLLALAAIVFFSSLPAAHAGCGCQKPPPNLAAVRPNATYAGTSVTLFSPSFQVGQVYAVDFASSATTAKATVTGTIVTRRDLADGVTKPQLTVAVPASLPLGPTSLSVRLSNLTTPVLIIDDAAFTVVPAPIALPQNPGTITYPGYQAAVARDGILYVSLDVSGVSMPRVYEAQAQGYPLTFSESGTAFYNIQGFLMQLLVTPQGKQPIPGMFRVPSAAPTTNSDRLHYSRHEFNSYYLQHFERQPHQVDSSDPNWHLDGTRHVDHNHLILAIDGALAGGTLPTPGATPPFSLVLQCFTLFSHGFVGADSISMSGTVFTDSYAPGSVTPQAHGDVFTNGTLGMSNSATVKGNASAGSFNIAGSAVITGTRTTVTTPTTFMPISLPAGLPDLGSINPSGTVTLTGPGSFKIKDLTVSASNTLYVDNSTGPVTLYITGQMQIKGGTVNVADPNPENFAVYVASIKDAALSSDATFNGVVYAPTSNVTLSGKGNFFGSFVGKNMKASGESKVHFDEALR